MNNQILGEWASKNENEATKTLHIVNVENNIAYAPNGFNIPVEDLRANYVKLENPFAALSGMAQFNEFVQAPTNNIPTFETSEPQPVVQKPSPIVSTSNQTKESILAKSLQEAYSGNSWVLKLKTDVEFTIPKSVIASMVASSNVDSRAFIMSLVDSQFDAIKNNIVNALIAKFEHKTASTND